MASPRSCGVSRSVQRGIESQTGIRGTLLTSEVGPFHSTYIQRACRGAALHSIETVARAEGLRICRRVMAQRLTKCAMHPTRVPEKDSSVRFSTGIFITPLCELLQPWLQTCSRKLLGSKRSLGTPSRQTLCTPSMACARTETVSTSAAQALNIPSPNPRSRPVTSLHA